MSKVHPNSVCVVLWKTGRVRLHPTQEWDERDPFVKANPGLFDTATPYEAKSPGFEPDPIERGTRAPGERRMNRRTPAENPSGDSDSE